MTDLAADVITTHKKVPGGWCGECARRGWVAWPCLPYTLALELTVTRALLDTVSQANVQATQLASIRDDTGVAT
jgi:hypothetical protein